MKRLLVTLATLVVVILSVPLVSFGLSLSGKGSATIDGVMSPGEWDNAGKFDFLASTPSGGTTPATLYVMNDGLNLYVALKVAQSSYGSKTVFNIDFDNNNNGTLDSGEDVIQMQAGTSPLISPTFYDMYRFLSPGGTMTVVQDNDPTGGILPVGTYDVTGAANNDGTVTIAEFSHSLCSKDTLHDICLKPGDTVGFRATLRLYGTTTTGFGPLSGPIPVRYVDTIIPASGLGQITIPQVIVTRVIDIKPGSRENTINRKSEGKIPVAILSTPDWSAPAKVKRDANSLTFGHDGTERSLAFCNEDAEDVNGDGLPDLVCHFSTQLAGFQAQDTFGYLNGRTDEGAFTAKDSVRIVK